MTIKELENLLNKAVKLLEDSNKQVELRIERSKAQADLYKLYNNKLLNELNRL